MQKKTPADEFDLPPPDMYPVLNAQQSIDKATECAKDTKATRKDNKARALFFLSHMQQNSQDQCFALSLDLIAGTISNWFDMNAQSGGINETGMKAGVEEAPFFLLFLNDHTLTRYWVQLEVYDEFRAHTPTLCAHLN